jgi:hypothetical protein
LYDLGVFGLGEVREHLAKVTFARYAAAEGGAARNTIAVAYDGREALLTLPGRQPRLAVDDPIVVLTHVHYFDRHIFAARDAGSGLAVYDEPAHGFTINGAIGLVGAGVLGGAVPRPAAVGEAVPGSRRRLAQGTPAGVGVFSKGLPPDAREHLVRHLPGAEGALARRGDVRGAQAVVDS